MLTTMGKPKVIGYQQGHVGLHILKHCKDMSAYISFKHCTGNGQDRIHVVHSRYSGYGILLSSCGTQS